jgi:hypothetical protein
MAGRVNPQPDLCVERWRKVRTFVFTRFAIRKNSAMAQNDGPVRNDKELQMRNSRSLACGWSIPGFFCEVRAEQAKHESKLESRNLINLLPKMSNTAHNTDSCVAG